MCTGTWLALASRPHARPSLIDLSYNGLMGRPIHSVIEAVRVGGARLLKFRGPLDAMGVKLVKDSALGDIAQGERAIVLKVEEATELDEAGANDLVATAATIRSKMAAFALAGPYPTQILNSLVSYGVNTTVAMFSSAEEAILMVSATNPGTLRTAQEAFNRQPFRQSRELPEKIRRIYDETFTALSYGLQVLAGIGIRTLVEAVCKDVGTSAGTLEQRIDGLVDSDVLTKTSADILHRTRFLGNRAAHELEPPTLEQLNAALDVAEHLLATVYVMRRAASTLPSAPQRNPKRN